MRSAISHNVKTSNKRGEKQRLSRHNAMFCWEKCASWSSCTSQLTTNHTPWWLCRRIMCHNGPQIYSGIQEWLQKRDSLGLWRCFPTPQIHIQSNTQRMWQNQQQTEAQQDPKGFATNIPSEVPVPVLRGQSCFEQHEMEPEECQVGFYQCYSWYGVKFNFKTLMFTSWWFSYFSINPLRKKL